MTDVFKTIDDVGEGLYKEKGSKFIAFAHPVTEVAEVKRIIDHYKKSFHDARHVCYAYRLNPDGTEFRMNDDGEPSGTAGKPILGQLKSFELTNVMVVVIRYFGGTKLGVSGLINAYKEAAASALGSSRTLTRLVTERVLLTFDYPLMNDVMRVMNDENLPVVEQQFEMDCNIQTAVRLSEYARVVKRLKQIYGLKVEVEE